MSINPQPGDFGFATIAGHVGGWVSIGQALLRDACRFTHVFVVVFAIDSPEYPDGLVVEAMPGGARCRPLRDRLVPGYAYAGLELSADERRMVPSIARTFVPDLGGPDLSERGIGYSFLTYVVLALAQLHIPTPHLRAQVDRRATRICSQLADEFAFRLGVRLYADGRWRGDVTPGDIYYSTDPRVVMPAPASVDGA